MKWLFRRRKDLPRLESPPDDIINEIDTSDEPVTLTSEERALLTMLGIDEITGGQIKMQTFGKLEGLFRRFLADDRDPELRGIKSQFTGKAVLSAELNKNRSAFDLHFFECGGYGNDKNRYIAVVKTNDRFDILRIMETDGVNYGISTEDVITFLKKWETKLPFFIAFCEADTLVIKFINGIDNLAQMLREAIPICPDLVACDDSKENFEGLLNLVAESRELYFWWD